MCEKIDNAAAVLKQAQESVKNAHSRLKEVLRPQIEAFVAEHQNYFSFGNVEVALHTQCIVLFAGCGGFYFDKKLDLSGNPIPELEVA